MWSPISEDRVKLIPTTLWAVLDSDKKAAHVFVSLSSFIIGHSSQFQLPMQSSVNETC